MVAGSGREVDVGEAVVVSGGAVVWWGRVAGVQVVGGCVARCAARLNGALHARALQKKSKVGQSKNKVSQKKKCTTVPAKAF